MSFRSVLQTAARPASFGLACDTLASCGSRCWAASERQGPMTKRASLSTCNACGQMDGSCLVPTQGLELPIGPSREEDVDGAARSGRELTGRIAQLSSSCPPPASGAEDMSVHSRPRDVHRWPVATLLGRWKSGASPYPLVRSLEYCRSAQGADSPAVSPISHRLNRPICSWLYDNITLREAHEMSPRDGRTRPPLPLDAIARLVRPPF
jgi:hypothetical protein